MHLQYKLNRPISEVFAYLGNAQKFAKAHPIIYKIQQQSHENYIVFERLKIAFVNITFTYPTTIKSIAESNTIEMHAVVKKRVHIKILFKLSMQNGITLVEEHVEIKSILPIGFILKSIFKKQHKQLFLNIERNLQRKYFNCRS